jgi:hypothetical protein
VNETRPPDLRPGALLLSGLRRGALLVFLPVAIVGQILAWLEYAISGWYGPWSWMKIGIAYTLAGVRVPFVALVRGQPPQELSLVIAIGALTVAILVLAFRSGRAQARGLEDRPMAAALAGAVPGLGVALPMFVTSLLVQLGFPQFRIASLHPRFWAALVVPLVVVGVTGAIGRLEEARTWTSRTVAGVRGGAVALWWGIALSFVVFLVLAVVETGVTSAYGRGVGNMGGGGGVVVVHHALLLPNQSALVLSATMGSPVVLDLAGEPAAEVGLTGIRFQGDGGAFLSAFLGVDGDRLAFPVWYLAFLLVPASATIVGGRHAASGVRSRGEAVVRGVLAGVVFAMLAAGAGWAASVTLPVFAPLAAPSLGPDVVRATLLGLAWGIAGGTIGALMPERPPWDRRTEPG